MSERFAHLDWLKAQLDQCRPLPRLAYYEALDTAHCSGDYRPFLELLSDSVERSCSYQPYWWALGVEKEIEQALQQQSQQAHSKEVGNDS